MRSKLVSQFLPRFQLEDTDQELVALLPQLLDVALSLFCAMLRYLVIVQREKG